MPGDAQEVLDQLRSMANPANVQGMARYGINPENTLGISIPDLRRLARQCGRDHALAQDLWRSGIHEARILAAFVDEPSQVTPEQMDAWAAEFDSWDVCDQVCANLFDRTPHAYERAAAWSARPEEFVRRAGFALMAALAWHDKAPGDEAFLSFLPLIQEGATDERSFVRKAVNWALRQIGKRNLRLNQAAIDAARRIEVLPGKSARWVARDALRELESEAVRSRLRE